MNGNKSNRKWKIRVGAAALVFVTVAPVGISFAEAAVPQKSAVVKSFGCRVAKSGRISCTYVNPGPRVWNNGKARGYFWSK